MHARILAAVPAILAMCALMLAEEPVCKRPYEMVWANRTEDTRPALVDFENLEGWTVDGREAVAEFTRSREQPLWGQFVGKLVYRGNGANPTITLRSPEPAPISLPFDCVNLWLYGNNLSGRDKTTPPVEICVLLRGAGFAVVAAVNSSQTLIPALYAVPLLGMAAGLFTLASNARLRMPRFAETISDIAWNAYRNIGDRVRPNQPTGGAAT